MKQVNDEIRQTKTLRIPQDRFVVVMQVSGHVRATRKDRSLTRCAAFRGADELCRRFIEEHGHIS